MSIAVVALLIFALSATAFAAPDLRWTNTFEFSPNIVQGSNIYSADIYGNPGTNKISCTMVLYEKSFWGSYTEVARTSETVYQGAHFFSGNYTYTSGKTYRLDATATIYINGVGETLTQSVEKKV